MPIKGWVKVAQPFGCGRADAPLPSAGPHFRTFVSLGRYDSDRPMTVSPDTRSLRSIRQIKYSDAVSNARERQQSR